MTDSTKIIIEKHEDGFVAYPLGLKGVIVGEGDTFEDALADVKSAIRFHIETFGDEAFENDSPVLEAFIAETRLAALMNKTLVINLVFSIVCISFLAQMALAITNLQTSCVTKITKEEMAILLRDADVAQLKLLSEKPEEKKKTIENLKQLLSIACQSRKEGIANDPNIKRELENIRRILTATIYEQKIKGGRSPMQPFRYITEEQVNKFWADKSHEADFQEFLHSKLALAKESGKYPKDKKLTEEEIKRAKSDYAKITIYEAEVMAKSSELGDEFRRELELQIKLQQSQFLSGTYTQRVLTEKNKVTDEEIQIYIAKHPEFNTKAQKTKILNMLQRAKAKKILDIISENNPIEIEDFEIPKVSVKSK